MEQTSQISLQPTDRELVREVVEKRVGHSAVSLRILKIDWIDLVRHSRASHLASNDLLFEVIHGDVQPYVSE